jgi:cell division protein FtsB
VAVIVAVAIAYVHPLRSYDAAEKEVAARKAELRELTRENARLEHRVSLAGTEEFVVREARKLGLVRPGERLFIVQGAETKKEAGIR